MASTPHLSTTNRAEDRDGQSANDLLRNGMCLHQAHRYDEAAAIYGEILSQAPRHFDALHLLGVLYSQTGHPEEAVRLIAAALKVQESPAAVLNLALVLAALGRNEEALVRYDQAIVLQPDSADAFNGRGNVLKALNRTNEAVASYDRAIALNSEFAEAHLNRGAALSTLNQCNEALADFDRALALRPEFPEAWNNRGNVLRKLQRSSEAVLSFDRAIALRPNYAGALKNRVVALSDLNRFDEALINCDQILASQPDDWEGFYMRGNVLGNLHRPEAALLNYSGAIDLHVEDAKVPDEAHDSRESAEVLRPTLADIYWNRGLLYLLLGDFEKGWQGYEWRWRKSGHRPVARSFSRPLWDGKTDLHGMTVLLHGEQGFGDTIQFCRYAKNVAALGGRVMLEVPTPLTGLLRNVAGVGEVFAAGSSLPDYDCHCPLLSLPMIFKTRLDSIPAEIPYLQASPEKVLSWERRAREGDNKALRVGLVWSGSPTHANDRNRSMPLAMLLNAIPLSVEVYSLQKEVRPEDHEILQANKHIVDCGKMVEDFDDTAALITLMDVVISVDTAVAHLAGALGARTWLLLPFVHDWRWLMDRPDSPWYPTMRLFRQPTFGDWDSVVAAVKAALVRLSLEKSRGAMRNDP